MPSSVSSPTIDQAGLRGYEVLSWEGVFAPVGTSSAIITRLNAEIGKIVNSPEVRKIWKNKGVDTVTGTPEDLGKKLGTDYTRLGELLTKLKLKK